MTKNLEGNTPDGSAYHGYWQQDIYNVNEHFGSSSDLKALSQALHNRGMYLMVDIVINHMGYYGAPAPSTTPSSVPSTAPPTSTPTVPVSYTHLTLPTKRIV